MHFHLPQNLLCREADRDAVKVMRRLVASYFDVVKNNMKDQVPKVIMRFVVLHTEKAMHGHLIAHLLKCGLSFDSLCAISFEVMRFVVLPTETSMHGHPIAHLLKCACAYQLWLEFESLEVNSRLPCGLGCCKPLEKWCCNL